jgi:hypothetical protein
MVARIVAKNFSSCWTFSSSFGQQKYAIACSVNWTTVLVQPNVETSDRTRGNFSPSGSVLNRGPELDHGITSLVTSDFNCSLIFFDPIPDDVEEDVEDVVRPFTSSHQLVEGQHTQIVSGQRK